MVMYVTVGSLEHDGIFADKEEALQRIEEIRKNPLVVFVHDPIEWIVQ